MQHIDYEEEEPIFSENTKQQKQIQRFREYLVSSGTIEHFIKFLFGLRSKQHHDQSVPNSDALQMFEEYFGALTPDTTEQEALKTQIQQVKTQNQELKNQLEQVKQQLQVRREQIAKAEEEKRLREQEQAKNPKKGGKK